MFNQIFEKSFFSNEELQSIFEEIIITEKHITTNMSYQEIIFVKEDVIRVLSKKGEFAYLKTTGTGYTQWILYHVKEDNNIVFILRSPGLTWNWSWKNLSYQEFLEINKISTFSKL